MKNKQKQFQEYTLNAEDQVDYARDSLLTIIEGMDKRNPLNISDSPSLWGAFQQLTAISNL